MAQILSSGSGSYVSFDIVHQFPYLLSEGRGEAASRGPVHLVCPRKNACLGERQLAGEAQQDGPEAAGQGGEGLEEV